jgi:hypothetical protein
MFGFPSFNLHRTINDFPLHRTRRTHDPMQTPATQLPYQCHHAWGRYDVWGRLLLEPGDARRTAAVGEATSTISTLTPLSHQMSPDVTSHMGMMFNDKTRTEGLEMVGASTTSCETQERD